MGVYSFELGEVCGRRDLFIKFGWRTLFYISKTWHTYLHTISFKIKKMHEFQIFILISEVAV